MDIDDGSTDAPGGGNYDIDQSLLQQFSCLGTTDKDELVQQLQKLLGSRLNYSTAAFFLDMNNWNLQAAICSYLDVETPRLPSMTLVVDPTVSEVESIGPSTRFTKTWHIENSGNEQWPSGCVVVCAAGDSFGVSRVPVPCLQPGEGHHLTIEMVSPTQPGIYQTKWRLLTTSGSYFGDTLWTFITVVEQSTVDLAYQLSHMRDLGSPVSVQTPAPNPFVQPRSHMDNIKDSPTNEDSNMC